MATKLKAKAPAAVDEPSLTPDEQAQVGFFAKVVQGPHEGRYGVVQSMGPKVAVLRTRDGDDENLLVNNNDLRPDLTGRR